MPFLISALAILYYAPYIAFLYVNSDINALKDYIKKKDRTADLIVTAYLTNQKARRFLNIRVYLNIVVKLLYLCSNLVTLLVLNNVLNEEFLDYGRQWIDWSRLDNSMAFDYMGMRNFPKPGE